MSGLGRARDQARKGLGWAHMGVPIPRELWEQCQPASQPSWQQGPPLYPWCPGLDRGMDSPNPNPNPFGQFPLKEAEWGLPCPAVSRGPRRPEP